MRIAIDCDPNGIELKDKILSFLNERPDVEAEDLRYLADHPEQDYPDVALHMALAIREKKYDRGILICGTGLGMAMTANKAEGIYAGTCHDVYSAERLVKSNDAQVLCLGAFVIGVESAKKIVEAFVSSVYEGGRSARKVQRLREIEREMR